ncbi:anaerobic sulfatase maturase [bacterium]|nr:anaerobic sulfatase maturase [bacterium]
MSSKILNSLLIKPAGPDCNLACKYCFYLEKADLFGDRRVHRMDEAVLESMIKQALSGPAMDFSFGWQGGEPTLMGLVFFRKVVEFQKRYGQGRRVSNSLQTNGILIDEDWGVFLKEYQFLVGLSLDGPEHIHDHYRKKRDGSGSWRQVMESARLMLDLGVEVNALVVVNDYSVQFPEEIYQFHKDLGLNWMQFIPCVESDVSDPSQPAECAVSGVAFGKFLMTLFDLWWADLDGLTPGTNLRFFDAVLHHYVSVPPPLCTLKQVCGDYLVVEHNGNVYPCDFYVEKDYLLGNVLDDDINTLSQSAQQEAFGRAKSKRHDDCQTCEWLRLCWGGCPKDRIGDSEPGLSHLCEGYQLFFAHAHERFTDLAQRFKRREAEPPPSEIKRNDLCPCGSGKKYKQCCGRC